MGSQFNSMTVKAEAKPSEVKRAFEDEQDRDRYENGHRYSGGFGMADGLEFSHRKFSTIRAAEDWLDDNAQKWGAAICVRLDDGTWVIGANCSC